MKINSFKYIYALSLFFLLSACEKEKVTEGVSRVTFFVDLELQGESEVFLKQNESFVDPGAEASENGTPVEVNKSGTVDPSTPDFYNLIYSAKNSDGFSSQVNRTVVVYEPNEITGVFDGTRVGRNGGLVLIKSAGENSFIISDLLGGHYEYGRGFGRDFAAPAVITIDGNTFTTDGGVCAFGPVVIQDAVISDDQRDWTWTITLTDFDFSFEVSINKLTE